MWIQVRTMDGKKSVRVDGLSKLTKIEALREKLVDLLDAEPNSQRLFYRGKMLVDGHSLFDYDVGLNEIIQVMIKSSTTTTVSVPESQKENIIDNQGTEPSLSADLSQDVENEEDIDSSFKLGDVVDARDEVMGAWFEAKIMKITKRTEQDREEFQSSKDSAEPVSVKQVLKETNNEGSNQIANKCAENSPDDQCDSPDTSKMDTSAAGKGAELEPVKSAVSNPDLTEDDGCTYHMVFEGDAEEDEEVIKLPVKHIRPRARHKIPLAKLEIGQQVMVNYNYDNPEARGYWYDAVVTNKRDTRTIKEVTATVFIGSALLPMKDCKILFLDEIFQVEKAGNQSNINSGEKDPTPEKRESKPNCDHCHDNPRKKCKSCSCCVCGDKCEPDKQILCDECDQAYHLYCLKPPLTQVPDVEEWYCPECKTDDSEVVRAGEKLKQSKKKSKMASASSNSGRDWGKGMACVGRTKLCSIVPPNHFGPIPGVEVGTLWKFRVQVSEAGVHRPHVAGIHGREDEGAYSIVLSGGYEDDHDDGDEFTYTGSGGRDLSGNKRTAEQSCDQILTRMNKALAKNCNAPLDNKKGAEAKDWKAGKPVRVVRNCKGRKHSEYAPEEGNRYDGIYKMVKYWPEPGKSGFVVWRYFLRRDDPTPPPWSKEGSQRVLDLGLEMQYPEGWLESQREKEAAKENGEESATKVKGRGRKRKKDSVASEEEDGSPTPKESPSNKKKKVGAYKVEPSVRTQIEADRKNEKLWQEALEATSLGAQKFLAKVEELFVCVCCQEIPFKPITTECLHNVCKPCLQRSYKAEVYSCPACRTDLGKDNTMATNDSLMAVLNGLFPGYESGR